MLAWLTVRMSDGLLHSASSLFVFLFPHFFSLSFLLLLPRLLVYCRRLEILSVARYYSSVESQMRLSSFLCLASEEAEGRIRKMKMRQRIKKRKEY